jgi:hypothetical protein
MHFERIFYLRTTGNIMAMQRLLKHTGIMLEVVAFQDFMDLTLFLRHGGL